jgi:3-hydroxyisobutyrate dehydrogenase-like beta-hydroxyacid dehydrogenase
MKVGFIGLGNMGLGMASNLLKAGHRLTVYNRTESRADALRNFGASVADTPAQATSGADVMVTMLADDRALEAVLFGGDGALQSLAPGAAHISMSTISVAFSRRLIKEHGERKQHYNAAPVFGRPDAAAAAKLFIVAAGDVGQMDLYLPLLEALGQRIFRVGDDPAAANVIKLAGNFMITTVIESLAESFALMRKSGIAPETFLEVITGSLFAAPIYKTYGALIASNNFDQVGFALPLGLKDNRLVVAAADEAGVPLPLASLVHDRFITAIAQGLGNYDWSAIARLSFESAGLSSLPTGEAKRPAAD